MSVLHHRIINEHYMTEPAYHPIGTKETPMATHAHAITYQGDTVLYGTLHPLVTADGAVVPASADVAYPQPVPAGRA